MKKVCILLIIFLGIFSYGLAVESPIEKGSFLISGRFSFNNLGGELYEDINGNRWTAISVVTSANYFAISRLAFGINFEIVYQSQGEVSLNTLGIGPSVSLYLGSLESKASFRNQVFPFVGVAFYYVRDSQTISGVNSIAKGTMVGFGGGLTYMVTNTVGLTMGILYHIDHLKYEDDTSYNGNVINIGVGIDIFIYGKD